MDMDYERFVRFVKLTASIPGDVAGHAIASTLQTLGVRLTDDTARAVTEKLPPELAPYLAATGDGAGFTAPGPHVRAVMNALRRTVGDDTWADVAAELGPEASPLLAPVDGMPAQEFVARVGSHRLTDAVLETLAERVTGDDVERLVAGLPIELRAPLRRGKPDRDTPAQRLTVEQFVARIGERAGDNIADDIGDVVTVTRGAFGVLRDALPEKDFYDIVSQLPLDYSVLLPRP